MKQTERNELFRYFNENHNVLLTHNEIDSVIELVKGNPKKEYLKFVKKTLNIYRIINAVIFVVLWFFIPRDYIGWIIFLFVAYNIIHVLFNVIKKHYGYKKR